MDSPHKPKSISTNLVFFFLLLSTNLFTLFFSSAFYSSSSCTLNPLTTVTTAIASAPITTTTTTTDTSSTQDLPSEFLAFTSGQLLPFGFNTNFDSDTIYPPVGQSCTLFPDELKRFMTYKVNGSCPDDEILAQKLLLKGCEPLPRRRCRPAAQPSSNEPYPLPKSLWTTPPDSSVVWTAYTCKNYACLINRYKTQKGFDDCKDCFDLNGREKTRWSAKKTTPGSLDFTIDEVLATKKPGTIRIGLDIGGGVATFAVRMRERNITIITTSMNLNGPFNNFIASRGVIPLYISISQRLPFFDNTLDIVHSMHVLSNWIPTNLLHFLMFDVYRVLRPGGLFWVDHFFCVGEEFEKVYEPLILSIGFNKLKWVVGRKLDRGPELREMYLSALLEKPLINSW
ncbi:probable methyltransferase At1g29790 [Mercurialis annua]|uniref:probable methyltransferase At1g29790 n=1 Tax=Mercurialis annua TaxID=3986 RepID=UPI00215E7D3B|nr:probable methyltransferase At1g29790 [Mercurialis annua]